MVLLSSTKELSKITANVTMGRTLECAEVTTLGRRTLEIQYIYTCSFEHLTFKTRSVAVSVC